MEKNLEFIPLYTIPFPKGDGHTGRPITGRAVTGRPVTGESHITQPLEGIVPPELRTILQEIKSEIQELKDSLVSLQLLVSYNEIKYREECQLSIAGLGDEMTNSIEKINKVLNLRSETDSDTPYPPVSSFDSP